MGVVSWVCNPGERQVTSPNIGGTRSCSVIDPCRPRRNVVDPTISPPCSPRLHSRQQQKFSGQRKSRASDQSSRGEFEAARPTLLLGTNLSFGPNTRMGPTQPWNSFRLRHEIRLALSNQNQHSESPTPNLKLSPRPPQSRPVGDDDMRARAGQDDVEKLKSDYFDILQNLPVSSSPVGMHVPGFTSDITTSIPVGVPLMGRSTRDALSIRNNRLEI